MIDRADPQDCPYVGLDPFSKTHEDFFFGREQDSRVLADHVMSRRVTVLYGPSGVGKSSVLNVGLPRELNERSSWTILTLRDWQDPTTIESRAIEALRSVLPPDVANSNEAQGGFAQLALAAQQATKRSLLLILDQFEEYFLYRGDSQRAAAERGLSELLVRRDVDVRILIGIRDDSLHLLDRLRATIPGILDTTVRLAYLSEADVERAIRGPIGRYNERYRAGAAPVEIEDALVAGLIRDLRQSGGGPKADETGRPSDQIELPYLQLTMTKLWEADGGRDATKLRLDTLTQKLGGVQQIMQQHVDQVLAALPRAEQALCADLLRYLVTPGGAKIAYPAADLAASVNEDRKSANTDAPEATPRAVEAVLQKLTPTETRLLKPVKVRGADAFELFHDVLAQPVLRWRREFVAKATLERESRRLATQRDESERIAKRRLNLLVASGAALALTIGLAVFSVFQWSQAKQALENYKVEQTLRHAEEQRRQQAEAANKEFTLRQERTQAIEGAVSLRAKALIAASSRQDYNAAVDGLTAALSIFEKFQEWSGVVHTKVERGKIYALSDRLAAAQKDLDEALETAARNGNLGDRALALESEASLHERQGAADTATLYRQAEDQYRAAGDSLSVARIQEWRATRAEKAREFATAVDQNRRALERYRIAGDMIGAERIQEALGRTVPWGFLADLNHGKVFPMRGDKVHVGRDSPEGAENDVSFPTKLVSRRHLVVSRTSDAIEADDERSLNGTTVNAAQLLYGQSMQLADGDILALANTEVVQFTRQAQPPSPPPPNAWAIFINGPARTYAYLTETSYSVVFSANALRLEAGENPLAVARVRNLQKPELFAPGGGWILALQYKKTDYDYPRFPLEPGKWTLLDGLPASLVKLSADRKNILEEGPAFQIVVLSRD